MFSTNACKLYGEHLITATTVGRDIYRRTLTLIPII